MNEELKKIAVAAGAPEEMVDQLWFNIFCKRYANLILEAIEQYDEFDHSNTSSNIRSA